MMSESMVWRSRLGFEAEGLPHSRVAGRFNVYIADNELHTVVVLAEREDNPGASITNAYERYAEKVCAAEEIAMERCLFYELYVDPGHRDENALPLEKDGVAGSATLDRVQIDPKEEDTHWFPGGRMGEQLWASLRRNVDLHWSYPVPRALRSAAESS
jgi:hypothetical protein